MTAMDDSDLISAIAFAFGFAWPFAFAGNAIAFLSVACQEKSMAAICDCGTCKPSTLNNSLGEPRGCFSTRNRHE